ncbi:hypothetical protein RHMOL_Rhmol12G0165500 [Rhododendron molle]|uniref:Uncharacterized protein n=1 Tax=Rhododendron molle TaxID=49168 RepID=A0ACC0LIV0_RHOML|nr:hypothetical protein RHMOL_Rhmol12G0165500 [Rhododendron molle]
MNHRIDRSAPAWQSNIAGSIRTDVLPIACLSSGGNESYVFVVGTELAGSDFGNWYNFCEEKVVVTVMDSEIDDQSTNVKTGSAVPAFVSHRRVRKQQTLKHFSISIDRFIVPLFGISIGPKPDTAARGQHRKGRGGRGQSAVAAVG